MSTSIDSLPWSSLKLSSTDIPWDDLRAMADAAARSGDVRTQLMREVDRLLDERQSGDSAADSDLTDLAVLAVFALAAERLDGEGRRDLAAYLIQLLYRAGELDDEFLLEVAQQAAGRLGPALIQPAVKLIETKGCDMECWFHLCDLLSLAKNADDATKASVVRLCRQVIREDADRFEPFCSSATAAWVLAELNDTGSLPLLRSIYEVSRSADLGEAIATLEVGEDYHTPEAYHTWSTPVDKWLPERIEQVRSFLSDDDDGDDPFALDEDMPEPAEERYGDLLNEFVESEAYAALPDDVREHAGFAVEVFLSYAWEHLGIPLEELQPPDVSEILLDRFPRKITAERSFYELAPRGLVAFVDWLGATGRLQNPRPLRRQVLDDAEEMLARSQDPRNWGPAKSLFVQAEEAGVEITDERAMQRFVLAYNQRLTGERENDLEDEPPNYGPDDYVTRPIIRDTPKVGRNDPCICGSGKKFKKCCGR